ncbi:MAG: AAA family ATPase [Terriglobia bacterium]
MLKTLRVKNYLSLRDLDLELTGRNVLVGPNMAGKSNLVDCLRFLTQVAQMGLIKAFIDRGGFSEVVWKGTPTGHRISISLSGEEQAEGEPTARYQYEISILGSPTGFTSIEREQLTVETNGRTFTLADLKHGQGSINRLDGSKVSESTGGPTVSALELSIPGWEGMKVKEHIASWRFYKLVPEAMKQANAAVAQNFLTERGENLSSWLMTLSTKHPEEIRRFKQAATDALPGLEEILSPPTQFATTYLQTREKHLREPVNIWRMADGELVFLALLSLILSPVEYGAPLFCVEEPETHLHPRLLDTLVELQKQVQEEFGLQAAQVLITTHSPYLVDRVELEDLVVVEKREGATQCRRPSSKAHLKELLTREEAGLGELWYSGALGGV